MMTDAPARAARSADLAAILDTVREVAIVGFLLGASAFFASNGISDLATGCVTGCLALVVPRPRSAAIPPQLVALVLGVAGIAAARWVLA